MAHERAIAYVRVSVVGDRAAKGRFESPDLQRAAIDDWCRRRGIEVVAEVQDLNRSGGTLTRPGLHRAMERLASGDASGIVVARSDRASRRAVDGLGLIDELERRGQWIAAADGTIDTTTRTGRMATTMHFAMAQSELERFKEQSAEIHRRAILDKGRHMGPAPFGYVRDSDGRLAPDPAEARIVRSIFERRADGAGWVQLARTLDQQGVRQRNGRLLSAHMLARLTRRRVYAGEASHGAHTRSNAHPAIVSEGLWAAANRVTPAVRSDTPQRRVHDDSLLRGLLRCGGCRYVMKRLPGRVGEGPRWRCRTLASERSATHECAAPARLSGFEGQVAEAVTIGEFLRLAAGEVQADRRDVVADIAALTRRLAEAEALLDELSSLEVRRQLGADRWAQMTQEARTDVESAQRDLATARAQASRVGIADRATLEAGWQELRRDRQQELLRSIVQAIFVSADGPDVRTRLNIVPTWVVIDFPRQGAHDFVARPWRAADRLP